MPDEQEAELDPTITAAQRRRTEQRWIRFALIVILVVVLAAFILDNSQSVTVGFLFFEQSTPLFWVLFITALMGAVIGQLIRWRRQT